MEETGSSVAVIQAEQERWSEYPANHWKELQRFVEGNECDPKQLFLLSEDIWDAWPYAQNGRPTEAVRYRFHFQHLRSFLKPYVKWYCYQRLIGSGKSLSQNAATLPYYLTSADDYLLAHNIACLEDLATPSVFAALWESLVKPHDERLGPRPRRAVMHQLSTRTFWEYLRVHFGAPEIIPPHAPHMPRRPAEFAVDEQQIIPMPVIRQLINRLALHRDGKDLLNRYHHLRLCVLVLMLCLGRRVDEVLATPRGGSPDGPLHSYPAKGIPIEDALWFQFSPNKQGPRDLVYISPEWRDIVHYCVRQLCTYSDEVRHLAPSREQSLLILISPKNWTAGCLAARTPAHQQKQDRPVQREDGEADIPEIPSNGNQAKALSQARFRLWLNGIQTESAHERGMLERWKVTTDGSADGPIYHLRTHQTRHTRHSALSKDPQVSLLTRQRDLNHCDREMQFAYQHTLHEQNEMLLEKARAGKLFGPALPWLTDMLRVQYHTEQQTDGSQSQFHPGYPALLNERWRALIARSPYFLHLNRVSCGYCALPQGPEGCTEYMNCLEATDEGCQWFVTDPENEEMLVEIQDRVVSQKLAQKNSLEAGHVVQAHKYEVLSRRAEGVQEEVLRRSSQDLRERLKTRKQELEAGLS